MVRLGTFSSSSSSVDSSACRPFDIDLYTDAILQVQCGLFWPGRYVVVEG